MRRIKVSDIKKAVAQLCGEANFRLRPDVLNALNAAYRRETSRRAKDALKAILENARIAKEEDLAICQDTGMPVVFVEIGRDARIVGAPLKKAINEGVESGYKRACLRSSVVRDPLLRGRPVFAPAVIHYEISGGRGLKLAVLPKGFGCENKTQVRMFKPTADIKTIKEFIIDAVRQAGPDACPPFVVGVGIGGTQDYACLLAKKALLRKIKNQKSKIKTTNQNSKLEKDLLKTINRLNIGPMGLGGKTTALAVNVLTYPTHIAGLPVCVNISCHALRSATIEL